MLVGENIHSNMLSNKMPCRILWSLQTFQKKIIPYWPIPNNHCILRHSNMISTKIAIWDFVIFTGILLSIHNNRFGLNNPKRLFLIEFHEMKNCKCFDRKKLKQFECACYLYRKCYHLTFYRRHSFHKCLFINGISLGDP